MSEECSRLRRVWLSRPAALALALASASVVSPAFAADEKPPAEAPSVAKSALSERFDRLSKTIGSIDASAVPCKLGAEAVGCAEAAKAASADLKQVRKQLTKAIRQLRKEQAKRKLARALEFGSSLNRLKGSLRKLGAADNAEDAQDALKQLSEDLDRAKGQLKQLNEETA